MRQEKKYIGGIPAIIWGEQSSKVYLFVHGKLSSKEAAEGLAEQAVPEGYQVISFDLPKHGERKDREEICDVWTGMHDLTTIMQYVKENWQEISLYACSLGAYFSLMTYQKEKLHHVLFQSPIVNMEYLIRQMFVWFQVSEAELQEKQKIETPIDTLSWDYYKFAREHQVQVWNPPTTILYGTLDNLQSQQVIEEFSQKFHVDLHVAEGCEHPFMKPDEVKIAEEWQMSSILKMR